MERMEEDGVSDKPVGAGYWDGIGRKEIKDDGSFCQVKKVHVIREK